ncbi:MAG: polyhydroxybutyrate depolymerase [Frankiales bacterium]|nr:polyhydroxybutyrate depolymerase [Frankiales bacterium]
MPRLLVLLLAPLLLLGALPATPASPAEPAERRTVTVGSVSRPYLLARPPAGTAVQGAVLVAHAQNQTMGQALKSYRLEHLPVRGQLVAYLGGYAGSWNSGGCCGRARAERVDDLGYLSAVLADLRAQMPAGLPASMLGYSSGAMLAYAAVCHAQLGLRLVVSVAGTRSSGCTSASLPYRFVELHGARDTTIALDPPGRYASVLGTTAIPARPATRTLAQAAGCTRTIVGTNRTDDGGCRGGGVVRLLVAPTVGHSYEQLRAPYVLTRALEEVGQVR